MNKCNDVMASGRSVRAQAYFASELTAEPATVTQTSLTMKLRSVTRFARVSFAV